LPALGLLSSDCLSPAVSESGRFVCGGGLGRLSGRHASLDGSIPLWFCVWSAQFQGERKACGRSDFIGDRWRAFACATCPGVRAIQRGYLPFLGSGGQLLALLSSVLEVIATLCVSRHASASRPGCALARSLVGCRRWRRVSVNAIDLGGEEPWLVRASLIGHASSPIHSLSVRGLVGYGSGSVSCVWSAQVVMRSCGGEVPLGRLLATLAEACSNLD
jgi:hypothetical protein